MSVQLTIDLPEDVFPILRTHPDTFVKEMLNSHLRLSFIPTPPRWNAYRDVPASRSRYSRSPNLSLDSFQTQTIL